MTFLGLSEMECNIMKHYSNFLTHLASMIKYFVLNMLQEQWKMQER